MISDRIVTSVYLSKAVQEHAKTNIHIKSLGEWVNQRYKDEFMNPDLLSDKRDAIKEQLEECERQLEALKNCKEDIGISKDASRWIKTEGLSRSKKFNVENVLVYFNNKFNMDLNLRQFKILLNKPKD